MFQSDLERITARIKKEICPIRLQPWLIWCLDIEQSLVCISRCNKNGTIETYEKILEGGTFFWHKKEISQAGICMSNFETGKQVYIFCQKNRALYLTLLYRVLFVVFCIINSTTSCVLFTFGNCKHATLYQREDRVVVEQTTREVKCKDSLGGFGTCLYPTKIWQHLKPTTIPIPIPIFMHGVTIYTGKTGTKRGYVDM